MLYIKFTKDYFEEYKKEKNFPELISRIIFCWKIFRGKFFKKNTQNGELIILPIINKKSKKNLLKYLELFNVKTICLSEELKDSDLAEDIKKLEINILNGQWLYKYLIKDIIEYVVNQKEGDISSQEISILINEISEIDIENILILSEKCKSINVITPNRRKFKKLEEYLYNEKGIILNLTQNYSKSLIKSDIIINMNFDEEELNKFSFPRKAVIISVQNQARVLFKGFDGLNICSYKIIIPKKYVSQDLNLESFNKEILYESFLYRKTNPKNIINIIEEDNLKFEYLVGINGKIKKNEYLRLQNSKR